MLRVLLGILAVTMFGVGGRCLFRGVRTLRGYGSTPEPSQFNADGRWNATLAVLHKKMGSSNADPHAITIWYCGELTESEQHCMDDFMRCTFTPHHRKKGTTTPMTGWKEIGLAVLCFAIAITMIAMLYAYDTITLPQV